MNNVYVIEVDVNKNNDEGIAYDAAIKIVELYDRLVEEIQNI